MVWFVHAPVAGLVQCGAWKGIFGSVRLHSNARAGVKALSPTCVQNSIRSQMQKRPTAGKKQSWTTWASVTKVTHQYTAVATVVALDIPLHVCSDPNHILTLFLSLSLSLSLSFSLFLSLSLSLFFFLLFPFFLFSLMHIFYTNEMFSTQPCTFSSKYSYNQRETLIRLKMQHNATAPSLLPLFIAVRTEGTSVHHQVETDWGIHTAGRQLCGRFERNKRPGGRMGEPREVAKGVNWSMVLTRSYRWLRHPRTTQSL